jgi:subtilisin family serine protease
MSQHVASRHIASRCVTSRRTTSSRPYHLSFWTRPTAKLCLLVFAVALVCLSVVGDGLAFDRRRGGAAPAPARPAVARPAALSFGRNMGFGSRGFGGPAQPQAGAHPGQQPLARGPGEAAAENHGIGSNPARPNEGERRENGLGREGGLGGRNEAGLDHRNPAEATRGNPAEGSRGGPPGNGGFRNGGFPGGLARNGLPHRPFPGEAGFTGVPARGETRFVSNEMVFHVPSNVAPGTVDAAARRLGLVAVGSQNLTLSGGTLFHFRIDNGRQVADVVRDLEAEHIGVAQPNYVYRLQQDARAPASAPALPRGDPAQYAVGKLHLVEAHKIATGTGVLIAVIDSQIDTAHPDLGGTIAAQFDAVGNREKPDDHGTEMTGAIVAHRKLLGVAPRARILAIHAFSPEAQASAQTTTEHILAGIDWAIAKGAKIINMSFAGPYDPLLSQALKKAHEQGIVLIAAAGNAGPQSPPLYPAADENVIAVTAVDENDKLLPQANQGPHVALAAPGVNILEPAPGAAYGFTTGTSVATALVSGVAALIIERDPAIDVATLEELLYSTARDLGPKGRDNQFGYGLVDPLHALNSLEAKVAMNNGAPPAATPPLARPINVSATPEKMTVSQVPVSQVPANQVPANPVGNQAPGTRAPASQTSGSQTSGSQTQANQAPANQTAIGPAPVSQPPANQAAVSKIPPSQTPLAPGPAAQNPATDFVPLAEKKRMAACLQEGTVKGVRGAELKDYTVICLAEARLTCLKQAVAQKVRGPDRRDFMGRCLGS